ncbi:hypothetical protein D1AOALGA4SA_11683 [Olavius algarvensis Delta 1 endosymbiont]|nr:hypothetical protein D1AOALGA4SA_11683 [Olavius algarvensis Delta 1 endosymbiont]
MKVSGVSVQVSGSSTKFNYNKHLLCLGALVAILSGLSRLGRYCQVELERQ